VKVVYKVLIICFIILSCDSDDSANQFKNSCSVDNPVEDLAWLKSEIERRNQNINDASKYCYIAQSLSKDQSIFIYGDCDPRVDKVAPVYNCSGENIGFVGDVNFSFEAITIGKIIWKTDDFICEF